MWLEEQGQAFVLEMACKEPLWTWTHSGPGQLRADALAAQLSDEEWERLTAGDGAKGPRVYDWARVRLFRLYWPGAPLIGTARQVLVCAYDRSTFELEEKLGAAVAPLGPGLLSRNRVSPLAGARRGATAAGLLAGFRALPSLSSAYLSGPQSSNSPSIGAPWLGVPALSYGQPLIRPRLKGPWPGKVPFRALLPLTTSNGSGDPRAARNVGRGTFSPLRAPSAAEVPGPVPPRAGSVLRIFRLCATDARRSPVVPGPPRLAPSSCRAGPLLVDRRRRGGVSPHTSAPPAPGSSANSSIPLW